MTRDSAIAWSPNAAYIAAITDGHLSVWNSQNGERIVSRDLGQRLFYTLSWSPNSQHLILFPDTLAQVEIFDFP